MDFINAVIDWLVEHQDKVKAVSTYLGFVMRVGELKSKVTGDKKPKEKKVKKEKTSDAKVAPKVHSKEENA